jgi:hypothetical protein
MKICVNIFEPKKNTKEKIRQLTIDNYDVILYCNKNELPKWRKSRTTFFSKLEPDKNKLGLLDIIESNKKNDILLILKKYNKIAKNLKFL